MKKNNVLYVVVAAAIGMTAACKKNDQFPDQFGQPVKADAILEKYAPALQSFQGDAGAGFSIVGEDGVKIVFPAGAFVDQDWNAVSGNVTVRLKEYLNKADILFGGMPTESYGMLLETGGEIFVDAFQGDKPLRLNPENGPEGENPVRVEVPRDAEANPEGMNLFIAADRDRKPGDNGNGENPWVAPNPVPEITTTWQSAAYYPFGNSPNTYWFNLPSFGWSNCDRLYNYPGTKVNIYAEPDAAMPAGVTDLQVLLVFRDIETVITLVPAAGRFESYPYSMPEGAAATLVMLGKDADGNFMLAHKAITITANETYEALPESVSQAAVDAFISSID